MSFKPFPFLYFILKGRLMRKAGVATLIYPEAAKMKKQMDYANRQGVPFVAFVGENEMRDNTVTLKNMADGSQETLAVEALIDKLQ